MTYGKARIKNGTPTTREYRRAARTAAQQLQRTADEFRTFAWPFAVQSAMQRRLAALDTQARYYLARSDTPTASRNWPEKWDDGRDSASQIRAALGLPPLGQGCPPVESRRAFGPPQGTTYWIRRPVHRFGQNQWNGMVFRREGDQLRVRTFEPMDSSGCIDGSLEGFTVRGQYRELTDRYVVMHLLRKGKTLRRFLNPSGNYDGRMTEWKRTTKQRYASTIGRKQLWWSCSY